MPGRFAINLRLYCFHVAGRDERCFGLDWSAGAFGMSLRRLDRYYPVRAAGLNGLRKGDCMLLTTSIRQGLVFNLGESDCGIFAECLLDPAESLSPHHRCV